MKLDAAGAPVWGKAITHLRLGSFLHVSAAPGGGYVVSGYAAGERIDLGAGRVVDGAHAFVAGWSP